MKKAKISDIAEINRKSITKNHSMDIIRYLDTSNITEGTIGQLQIINTKTDNVPSRAKRIVKKNTIIYSTVRPNQKHYGIITEPYENIIVSTGFTTIDADETIIDPLYLYYQLTRPEITKYLSSIAELSVSAYPSIVSKDISDIEINIIPMEKQKRVAKILYDIEQKIFNNNKTNDELEELLKTLYQRWFLEYEFLDEYQKPYKTNGGKLIYNEELKRKIPEDWKVENCYNNSLYKIIKPGVNHFNTKNYLATANINNEIITDGDWITYDNRESRANMQPINNSIWFAKMKNSIKHLTLPNNSEWFINKYILSTGFLGVECNNNSLAYIHGFLHSDYFEKVKDALSHGATQEAINNEDLKHINLLVPTQEVLIKYEKMTQSILNKKNSIIHENQKLFELKEFLLPLLMNEQIDLNNIEI